MWQRVGLRCPSQEGFSGTFHCKGSSSRHCVKLCAATVAAAFAKSIVKGGQASPRGALRADPSQEPPLSCPQLPGALHGHKGPQPQQCNKRSFPAMTPPSSNTKLAGAGRSMSRGSGHRTTKGALPGECDTPRSLQRACWWDHSEPCAGSTNIPVTPYVPKRQVLPP